MKSLIFALLLAIPSAWACKCNPAVNKALLENPDSASFPFVGMVEQHEGQRVVRAEAHWSDKTKQRYELEDLSSCRLKLPYGQRYLVLTSNSERLHQCHSVFVPIKDAAPMMEKLRGRVAADWAIKPSFVYCTQDAECAVGADPCQRPFGVATSALAEQQAWQKRSKWECPPPAVVAPAAVAPTYRAMCVQNLCLAQPN